MLSKYLSAPLTLIPIYLLFMTPAAFASSTSYSSNWAGYVATGGPFTSVSASWTVPSVASTPSPAYSSAWIGIGGAYKNSNKLVQAGTEQDVDSSGHASYSAWYEVYPLGTVVVGSVSAGDTITTTIS